MRRPLNLSARADEVRLALMLLTRIPAGTFRATPPGFAAAGWAFPLAGAAVGALAAGAFALALWLGLPALPAAGLAIAVQIVATGAMHEDAVADLCDGFWSGTTRASRLEIMRDSAIGSFGTLGLIVVVGLRWQATASLAGHAWTLVPVAMLSRTAPVLLMTLLPPARADGLGRQAAGGDRGRLAVALMLGCLPALVLPGAALVLVFAVAATAAIGALALARIGGQTGDALGAGQQAAELAALLVLVAHAGA